MAKIDPNEHSGSGYRAVGSGTKDFVAVGWVRRKNSNGSDLIEITSVCINDPTGAGDEGATLKDTFWLHTKSALSRLSCFATKGLNYHEPFDTDIDADMKRLISAGPFRATVQAKNRESGGKTYTDHKTSFSFERPVLPKDAASGKYTLTEEQVAMVYKATESFNKWKAEKASGQGGGGGGYSSGGGGSNFYDDDIPF